MIDLFEHRTAGFRFFLLWVLIVGSGSLRAAEETSPAYDKEVRPILSQFCFKCHGPDDGQRQGELRLDQREGATSPAASGRRAIRAGDVESSELVRRIVSLDAALISNSARTSHLIKFTGVLEAWPTCMSMEATSSFSEASETNAMALA